MSQSIFPTARRCSNTRSASTTCGSSPPLCHPNRSRSGSDGAVEGPVFFLPAEIVFPPLLSTDHLAPRYFVVPFQHEINGFGISQMFLLQNAGSKRALVIRIEHGNCLLYEDRAVVEFFVDQVHGAAGNFHPISESLFLRLEPGECGQQ